MHTDTYRAWLGTGIDGWLLAAEAAAVIGLRSMRFAAGGSARARRR